MTAVDVVPKTFDSLLGNISCLFVQAEATYIIHELQRLYPSRKDSFDNNDLYSTFKQLYKLGAIDEDEDQKMMEILVKKTAKKDQILKFINDYKQESNLPRKDDSVGREAVAKEIRDSLTSEDAVSAVNLYGESGVGKTTLAKAVSGFMEDFDMLWVDLRDIINVETVYFFVLYGLGLTSWDREAKRIYDHLENISEKTLLVLDNIEQFFENEVGQIFMEFLSRIINSLASHEGKLKIILTSKDSVFEQSLKEESSTTDYKVKEFDEKSSKDLMTKRIKNVVDVADEAQDEALSEIADLCRNLPYLLQGAEQLMRESFTTPTEVLRKITTQIEKGVPEHFACISALFESLPNDHLKQVAVKISLLRRPFSVSTAMKIADISSDYNAELDLEMLATHKILTAEDVAGERKYDLHSLFREFVASYLSIKDPIYKDANEKAENQFSEHFSKKFNQLAKNLDKDFVGTYKELEEDKANLELFIDLTTRKETLDLILQSEDVEETGSVAILFETFKSIKERRKLFGEWAKIMEKKESWLSSANFRCWESIQLSDMEGTRRACEALKRAEMSLAKAMLILKPEKLKAAKGLCKYCSGQIKCMTSANLIDESDKMEKERLLEEALFDLKQSLAIHRKVYGDHTLTARTLNLIGNCYMECRMPNEALPFYQRAMDMKIKLVGGEKHFDVPTYYNQLSQVYEALGKGEMKRSSETSFWSLYPIQTFTRAIWDLISQERRHDLEKATEFLEKALSLQKKLGVNDTDDTATFQRNLANILIGLQDYDRALEYGQKSLKIRNKSLGKHPETVRILYLIGIIHEWKNDHKAALASYEEALVMEESLPEDNHSVVRKLLCDRLEAMCKKLNKKDKLEEYRPRMEKFQKETDADAGKKPDADTDADAQAGEETDVITLDDKGGYYDFSSDYFFLEVPPNAVKTPIKVKYKVDPCRRQLPMAEIATDVSYFLEMSSSKTVTLNVPITVTLMHSGPGKECGYKTTVLAFSQDKYVWEEPELVEEEAKGSPACSTDFIRVQISKLCTLAVVTRLITDRFQVTPRGCVVRSSVCDDVTIEFPQGAVDKTVEGTMKLMLMPENKDACSILCMEGFSSITLLKSVIVKMPLPNNTAEYSTNDIRLLRLDDNRWEDNEWEDVTDQVKIVKFKTHTEFRVRNFSCWWPWIWKDKIQSAFKIFRTLCFGRHVCFAAFKDTDEDAPLLPKLTLVCAANHMKDKILSEMKGQGYSKLAITTSDQKMIPNDKAYPNVNGADMRIERFFLSFLKGEVCGKELTVHDTRQDQENHEELVIRFFPNPEENLDHLLLGILQMSKDKVFSRSGGEKQRTPLPHQTDIVYKMTSHPRGVAMIVNIENFTIDPGHPMYGKLDNRVGSQKDQEKFTLLFEYLDFKVETIDKTSGDELLAELHSISGERDFSKCDCFVLCIMSHGAKDCVYASDGGQLPPSLIVSLFWNSKCKSLLGKPKLFFFQGCRGGRRDDGVTLADAPGDTSESDGDANTIPETADILEFYSSYTGFKSYRYPETGSPFIQSIVEVFRKYACHHHILELITKVKKRVSEGNYREKKQMPQHNSTLLKDLYFWPEKRFSESGNPTT